MQVDHIFISYSRDYQNVIVRRVAGMSLREKFEGWRAGLIANYSGVQPRQRYRKSIAYGFVSHLGEVIMQIEHGILREI